MNRKLCICLISLMTLGLTPLASGTMMRQQWNTGVDGSRQAIIDFLVDLVNPTTAPDVEEVIDESLFRGTEDNYVAKFYGWLTVPATGDYQFHYACDDNGMLYVSPDEDMANAVEVAGVDGWAATAEWNKFPDTQHSDPISLKKGQVLAVMAFYQEGGGGDNMDIGWTGPGLSSDITAPTYLTDYITHIAPVLSKARRPTPETDADDVPLDKELSWTSGVFAGTHNVYFGDSFDDVNAGTTPTASGLVVNSFDPGRLEFGQTYFWRVDEVNGTPDKTVFKGNVWSFEAELYSIPISGSEIVASASSSSNESSLPQKTLDGSGLGEDNTHDMSAEAMWFTAMDDMAPWIQFEFDGVKKLDIMTIWNSNTAAEGFVGYGVMGVEIAYSVDGETWDVFDDVNEFSRAPGSPAYNQPDEISLGGLAAKMIRLNIQSNFGGFMPSYSLSEVQFSTIPAAARTPVPESGSVDISPDAVLSWRAGREAAQSTVYLGTDPNEVAEGVAVSVMSTTSSIDLSALDIDMGQTFYWRVDEVNETEVTSVWAGPVWSFSTVDAIVVDDFENYGNNSPDRPFQSWLDGIGYSADEFFSVGYGGNGTGAAIGHDIWDGGSEHYNGAIMETERTIAGSRQSMPFYYVNSANVASETQHTFAAPQDWTVGGAQLLSIAFFGQAGNTGTLYTKINGSKVTYPLEPTHIAAQSWKRWNIDLSELAINPQSVTTLAIGVDGNGASGMLLIDDIALRQAPPEPAETVSLLNNFDALPVGSSMHDVSGWEGWFGDAQWGAKIVDTVAYSGTHSLEIMGTRDDVVPNWPKVENGVYVASVMQYVPTGTDGLMHFGPLTSYGTSWDDTAWLGTLLSNATTGLVYINELTTGSRTEAPLLRDQWVQLRIIMNFDANACDFYYGDTLLGSLECPSAMGFDIWPDDDVDVIYYDDFSFQAQ